MLTSVLCPAELPGRYSFASPQREAMLDVSSPTLEPHAAAAHDTNMQWLHYTQAARSLRHFFASIYPSLLSTRLVKMAIHPSEYAGSRAG